MINDAQPNSWTPPLSQSWDWEQRMFGVNLGGWYVPCTTLSPFTNTPSPFRFVTEPFIVPALYETYTNKTAGPSVDEFTLSQNMGDQVAEIMEEHYKTFITEEDFIEMADAGLNWIRLPIGFWALETFANEPFLEGVAWKYIVQALGWARKYGFRVKLDLHATPGSANGWNHSGRIGQLNFLQGVMGLANAQRTLDYIGRLAEFINQPEWKAVVPVL
jgi:glucan 1,3-beta-glucosidase